MPPIRWALALALVLGWAPDASAKCAQALYLITAGVVAGTTPAPLAGASIVLFANDADRALPRLPVEAGPAATGPDGALRASYLFDTYSGRGILVAERCNARIRSLEVVVSHRDPQVRASRFRFKGSALRVRPGSDRWTFVVDLPVLEVWRAVDPPQHDGL